MQIARGQYREHAAGDTPALVYVSSYGLYGFPVSEAYYQARMFEPPMESLPWKEDYKRSDGSRLR
jgi:hypothetical protein